MNCQETEKVLHAYLDKELDLVHSLETEQHLKDCPTCEARYQEQLALRQALGGSALYFQAPVELRVRLRQALHQSARAEMPPPRRTWDLGSLWLHWLAPATALAGVALLFGVLWLGSPSVDTRVAQAVISAHIRSLLPDHLTDVASTDQHTVKPWFNGKLPFAPPVVDPVAKGFPLVGGRLDVVEEQPVAALVYQRRKHLINLFIWPSTRGGSAREAFLTQRGYNLVHWREGDLAFWAVSDVNRNDLQEFVKLVRSQSAPPSAP